MMAIFPLTIRDLDKGFSLAKQLMLGCALVVLLFFLFVVFQPCSIEKKGFFTEGKKRALFAYESIGSGPLTLNPHLFYRSAPLFLQEAVFIKKEKAPGALNEKDFLFGIKNTHEMQSIRLGEEIFLILDDSHPTLPQLKLSHERSSFSIKPLLSEKEGVLVEALLEKEGEAPEAMNLVIKEVSFNEFNKLALEAFEKSLPITLLSQGNVWVKDCLFDLYAGSTFAKWRTALKIEIKEKNRTCYHLLNEGDVLIFKEGHWEKSIGQELGIKAQLMLGEDKLVKFKVWDVDGILFTEVVLKTNPPLPAFKKEELTPKALKLRGAATLSALLGKKRTLLKKGDWVLKTAKGWRVLRTSQEIEDCLQHRIKGSLFILDEIEMENGKANARGHLFNEMRTEYQEVTLPIEIPKVPQKGRSNNKSHGVKV